VEYTPQYVAVGISLIGAVWFVGSLSRRKLFYFCRSCGYRSGRIGMWRHRLYKRVLRIRGRTCMEDIIPNEVIYLEQPGPPMPIRAPNRVVRKLLSGLVVALAVAVIITFLETTHYI
jgi:hypothetical protein